MPGSTRWVGVGSGSGQGFGRGPSLAGHVAGAVLRTTGVVVFATLEAPARQYGLHGQQQAISLGAQGALAPAPTYPHREAEGRAKPAPMVRRGLGHVITWLLGR